MESAFFSSPWFTYGIIPVAIFFARVFDVSMGTIRMIFISKGLKLLAAVIGFFEVLVWIIAISQIMQNLTNVFTYIAYAGGFATGTYLGIFLENRIAFGKVIVRVITRRDANDLIEEIKDKHYGVTKIAAEGSTGEVALLFMLVERSMVNELINTIHQFNPRAFYTIEDVRFVSEGIFPDNSNRKIRIHWPSYRRGRKGK